MDSVVSRFYTLDSEGILRNELCLSSVSFQVYREKSTVDKYYFQVKKPVFLTWLCFWPFVKSLNFSKLRVSSFAKEGSDRPYLLYQ